ncbi:multidrug ABC transporter permease [Candidatus Methylacidiphilum fumarolicum]|uniref:Transport permease protein n=2 Tax=Candidatus Methylacidiphilum fumarolicum TaxID=591154 RepID=I0JXQ5_METFB|nr:ABC transporter permease [Candidatus Methylacidiphilum fumarolicum]MBW6415394.1 ABC transporter permease [Candidatus Methylacidiphilum fumarolicum]TFE69165.1 multidrug ABC transporter permease [Candidatus Methylacidiphilum fumarolicum]TFE72784.1 multidrug ABC transporter permease [Candidatus Methylacidiphilum fumarolicum]TFE74679.1 multidrug ABC transporter permease [Candidatus Methylacidiphilum fumarolicum]TFE77736.1 multidrug ABC transporter permease [Candidatus Methylacidiphilum fumaroli
MKQPIRRVENIPLAIYTLWMREVVRFLRQKNRIIGALGTPLVFWLLIGSGVGKSFHSSNEPNYLLYFFPGMLLLILLFTAIFSTISIIEDRKEGFLQGVLCAPISRSSIVFSKLLGGTSLGLLQSLLVYFLSLPLGIPFSMERLLGVAVTLFLLGMAMTAVGYILAWPLDSVQGYHALMNLFLMPLWLLSGALFPAEGAYGWIKTLIFLNPLYYGLEMLRFWLSPHSTLALHTLVMYFVITFIFFVLVTAISIWVTDKIKVKNP